MYWFFFDRTDTRLAQQKEAAERALRLASDLPQAHVAMGYYHYHAHLDYPAALQEFERARAGRPGESEVLAAIAVVQRRQGRFREAYANLKEAVALDPRSYYLLTEAGNTALRLKAFAEAEQYFSRTAVLSPAEPMVYMRLALTRLRMTGDTAAVREVIQAGVGHVGVEQLIRLVYRSGGSEILLIGLLPSQLSVRTELSATAGSLDSVSHYLWNADHLWYGGQERMAVAFADSGRVVLEHLVEQRPEESLYRSLLGLAYAMTGRRAEAMKQAEEAIAILPAEKDAFGSETPLWQSARICAIVGEKDLAVDRLRRIPSLSGKALRVSPYWVSLRGHPGFQRLVASR
jgi:tetratricopeptide (TPR) repeat protein